MGYDMQTFFKFPVKDYVFFLSTFLLVVPLQVCASFITLLLAWFTKSRGSVDPDLDALLQLKAKFYGCIRSGGARLYFVNPLLIYCHHTPKRGRLKGHVFPNSLLEYNDNISRG